MAPSVTVCLKMTIADETRDNLHLLVLPFGRLNLHHDGRTWNSMIIVTCTHITQSWKSEKSKLVNAGKIWLQ